MNNSKIASLRAERPALSSLLILFGLSLIGMVIGGVLQVLVIYVVSGGGDMTKLLTNPQDLPNAWWSLVLSQGFASLAMFIGVGLLYWLVIERKKWADFNFKSLPNLTIFLLVFLIQFVSMPFNSWLQNVNSEMKLPESLAGLEQFMKNMEDQLADLTKLMTDFHSVGELIVAILVIGVIAGIGEELIFRGLVQRKIWLSSGNIHLAIWLAAAIFSAIHFQFYGFLPRLFLGALFGYLYYWSGNLWVPIAGHIFNNSFAIIISYLINIKVISPEMEKMETVPMSAILISAVLTIGLLYYFQKSTAQQEITN